MENSTKAKTCLIADNPDLFPEFHQNLLQVCQKCGFTTEVVTTGAKLAERWIHQKGDYRAVFVDLEMLEPLAEVEKEQIRERVQKLTIPIIAIGFHQEETAAAGKRYGISTCLLKFQQADQMIDLLKSRTFGDQPNLRRHPRYLINQPATFQVNGQTYSAEVINISIGGVFLKSMFIKESGTELSLEFSIDDGGPDISCICQVRHFRRKQLERESDFAAGMGVQFMQISETDLRRVEKLLSKLSPISMGSQSDKP